MIISRRQHRIMVKSGTLHNSSLINQCKRNLKNKLQTAKFDIAKRNVFLWCWLKWLTTFAIYEYVYMICMIRLTINDEKTKKRKKRLEKSNKMNRRWVNVKWIIIIEAELMAERCTANAQLLLYTILLSVEQNANKEKNWTP